MFELVRSFRKWVMIGAVILVTFAFGITGVVYSVLAPSRNPADEEIGTYSLSAVAEEGPNVSVKQREFRSFEERWNSFLIDRLSRVQMLFGRSMERGWSDRMIQLVMRFTMRQDPSFRFFPYVQSKYGVNILRNIVFLRSGGGKLESENVRMTPAPNQEQWKGMDRSQKARERWRDWSTEVIWRLMYLRDLAREAGFSATDDEIADLVQPYLNRIGKRSKRQISYTDFVQSQGGMGIKQFETTVKELITILKFLSSISRTTALDKDQLLDGFQEDLGSVVLLVSNIDHARVREEMYANRSWRIRQRYLELYPTAEDVESLSSFTSELGGDESNRSLRKSKGGSDNKSVEKRQFAYLFLPLTSYLEKTDAPSEDRLRTYYKNHQKEFQRASESAKASSGSNNEGEASEDNESSNDQVLPFKQVREDIRETLHRKRALRAADKDLQKLINSTISRKEIRGEPVDFQQLANQGEFSDQLEYRTSPLLDRDDMEYYLKEKKGVEGAQLENIQQLIFDRSLTKGEPSNTYLKESIWFKDGAVLPRLIRVESNVMNPSFKAAGNGAEATNWVLSEFSDRYPVPSLRLKDVLRRKKLERSASQRAKQLQQKVVAQYRRKRDDLWKSNDVYGPPVPPRYAVKEDATKGDRGKEKHDQAVQKTKQWPPASFSNESLTSQIVFHQQKWKRARSAFHQIAQRAGLEVHATKPFKLDEGPDGVEVQQSILNQIRSSRRPGRRGRRGQAELFEAIAGNSEGRSQVAVLLKKITKSGEDLDAFLKQQRMAKIQSERSSYLRNNLISLIEQANLSLANSSQSGSRSKSTN